METFLIGFAIFYVFCMPVAMAMYIAKEFSQPGKHKFESWREIVKLKAVT